MKSVQDIQKVAELARLKLTPAEAEKLSLELPPIMGYVAKLQQLDVANVEPLSHVQGLHNVMREDQTEACLPLEEGLKNAPDRSGRFFRTPLIVE
jgi:aspartyl-tRNA(Asn)/glutamyl-tRNA(Gln) amidotransferase subunit C